MHIFAQDDAPLGSPFPSPFVPVPGLKAGDITEFESDDLCNCSVFTIP